MKKGFNLFILGLIMFLGCLVDVKADAIAAPFENKEVFIHDWDAEPAVASQYEFLFGSNMSYYEYGFVMSDVEADYYDYVYTTTLSNYDIAGNVVKEKVLKNTIIFNLQVIDEKIYTLSLDLSSITGDPIISIVIYDMNFKIDEQYILGGDGLFGEFLNSVYDSKQYNLDVFSTDEDGNGYFLLFGTPLVLAFGPDYDGVEFFDDFDLFYEYFSYYSFLVNESDEVGFVGYDKKDDTIVVSGVDGCNFGGLEDFMTPQGVRSNVKSCANNGVIALYEDGKQVWENDYYDYSMIINPHIVGDYIVALGYSYDGSEVIVLDMEGTIIQKIQTDDEYYFLEGGDKSFMVSSLELDSDSICAITEDQNVFGLEFEDPADVGERDDRCYKKVNQVWYIPLTVETRTDGNGTVTAVESSRYGEDVEFTVTPKEGFVLGEVKVTDEFGNVVTFTDYHFTMPNANVVIDVTFLPENSETADIAIVALVVIALGSGVILLKNRKRLN